jgi:hypothetical protein
MEMTAVGRSKEMIEDRGGIHEHADALAEIDTRRRQAVALADPLPTWFVVAFMVFVASNSALGDLPAGRLNTPLGYAVALIPLALVLLRWRLRRATLHPSLQWLGWWIPCLALGIALPVVSFVPSYLAGLSVRYPSTVAGVISACVIGPLIAIADRLQRRYIIKRMAAR